MLEFLQILSFVTSLPPLVTVKCLSYKREDTTSRYTTEGKLLHYFSCLTVCIAFVKQKILSELIEPTVFKCKHWIKYQMCYWIIGITNSS